MNLIVSDTRADLEDLETRRWRKVGVCVPISSEKVLRDVSLGDHRN